MSLLLLLGAIGGDNIVPNEALHGHTVDASAIATTTEVQGLNGHHDQLTDQAIATSSLIVPADATHANLTDAGSLSYLLPADSTHSQTVDAATVSPVGQVAPHETLHATFTDQGSVYGAPPAELILELVVTTVILQLIGV